MNGYFRGYLFFRLMLLAITAVGFVLMGLITVGRGISTELKIEQDFHQRYAQDWQAQYEQKFGSGSLAQAHTKMIIGFVSMPVIVALLWLIFRQAKGGNGGGSRPRSWKKFRQKNQW